jgi:tetratricopeptide (TPR) repeat protein
MAGSLKEGVRLYRTKRWEQALAELLQVESPPDDAEAAAELAYFLGLCYSKLDRLDDALLYLEQVVVAAGDPMRAYQCRMALAYIYAVTNRSRLAEFELKQLIDQGMESVQIYSTLAYAAWTQKQVDPALGYYEKALGLDAASTTALNGLGYILADTERDPRRGLALCRRAAERKPNNPCYLDSVGWAYYKNGDLLEARTWLRRALDLAPRQREIADHFKSVTGGRE